MQALILADDLTGAADCGVQAARRGLRTTVSLRGVPAGGADVLAIDLDTAFDIAGRGIADPGSMRAALRGAVRGRVRCSASRCGRRS